MERGRLAGQAAGVPLDYSVVAGALTAPVGAPACPPCALPAAGRLGAAFVRPTAFRGATAGLDFSVALLWAARFRPGLAAAAAQRFLWAAAVRGRGARITMRLGAAAAGDPLRDPRWRFVARERDRPFEALRRGDENPDPAR
jgi:hypothetical protein